MNGPDRANPATAGALLLAMIVLGTGAGFGLGTLVGSTAPLTLAGLAVGFAAGIALVYTRFRDT